MLRMSRSFVIRMVLWSALTLYMACDFFLFSGPMKQELNRLFPTSQDELKQAISDGICAKVYNEPIYLSQVDRRVQEKLWRTGRSIDKIHATEKKILRLEAMDEIIDENLMRIKAKVNAREVTVTEPEIDAEVQRFINKFDSEKALDQALATQGIESRKELRFRMAARIQQEKYILSKINEAVTISDEEAKAWYNSHLQKLQIPEQRKVRHIFLATLNRDPEKVKSTLSQHFKRLKTGQINFSSLASSISEDPKSKQLGGDLGWMTRSRLPKDFATPVFSLPMNTPTLIQTKLGWHIVEITSITPPTTPQFDEIKQDIITNIANSRRKEAIRQYRHQLRLLNHKHVKIFPQVLKEN